MARLSRAQVFAADELAIVHVMNRTVRRCFLLGDVPVTGRNIRDMHCIMNLIYKSALNGVVLLGSLWLLDFSSWLLRAGGASRIVVSQQFGNCV